jgi:hypothetical protein
LGQGGNESRTAGISGTFYQRFLTVASVVSVEFGGRNARYSMLDARCWI